MAEEVNLIAAGWEIFADNCLPPDASPAFVQMVRATFYTGASYLMSHIWDGINARDEEIVVKRVADIRAEISRFVDERNVAMAIGTPVGSA